MNASKKKPTDLKPGASVQVLLIEDNPDDALAVVESLSDDTGLCNFDVSHMSSLGETRKEADLTEYQVVLCDLALTDSTGLDTLAGVRELAPGLPVVVMTGLDDEAVAFEAVRRGADDYLVKSRTALDALSRILGQSIERHRLRRELEESRRRETYRATHDGLTSLPNRHHFLECLEEAIAAFREGREPMFAVLFIDLDRFKPVNDLLGHSVGDRLLRILADRLRGSIRQDDTAARVGGDEFAVLLRNVQDPTDAECAAKHIVARLSEPVALSGRTIEIGVSLGIAIGPLHGTSGARLLRAADCAMYEAKSRGGGSAVYRSAPAGKVSERKLVDDFCEALHTDGLTLYYQPWIDARSGTLVGAEALVRWIHPQAGVCLPKTILPLAIGTGRMAAFSDWVLRAACRQIRDWGEHSAPVPIAVNVSAQQILEPAFPAHVSETLRGNRVDPRRLILEIPETGFRGQLDMAQQVLGELAETGVRIAVDDFGTGETSFSWLRKLPVDLLKIDRSFIAGMVGDSRDRAIVNALTSIGRTLGMDVVAEGVESEAERDMLSEANCRWMQGYLFGRPMTANAFERLLQRSSAKRRQPEVRGSRLSSRQRSVRKPLTLGRELADDAR